MVPPLRPRREMPEGGAAVGCLLRRNPGRTQGRYPAGLSTCLCHVLNEWRRWKDQVEKGIPSRGNCGHKGVAVNSVQGNRA